MPAVKSTGGYGGNSAQNLCRGRRTIHSSKIYFLIILLKNEYSLDCTTPTLRVRVATEVTKLYGALTLTAS